MPFKSDKQRKFLFAKKPNVAKKLAHKYNAGGVVQDDVKWIDPKKVDAFHNKKKKKKKVSDEARKKQAQAYSDWIDGSGPKPEGPHPSHMKDGGVVKSPCGFDKIKKMVKKKK